MAIAKMISLRLFVFIFAAVPAVPSSLGHEIDPETKKESGTKTVKNLTLDFPERFDVSLTLDNMELNNLPYGFVKGEFLTHLSLERSQIRSISPSAFEFLPRLTDLSLANNLLQNIDLAQFSALKNLKTLNLNSNCKKQDPQLRFEEQSHLRRAQFGSHWQYEQPSYYTTSTIEPSEVRWSMCEMDLSAEIPGLTKLYLENNDLKSLKFSEGKSLPLLTHLYLSGNELEMDNDMMSNMGELLPSLTELHIKNSGISQFDASQLPTVKSLYLDQNDFAWVCNEYCEYPAFLKLKGATNLETLSVSLSNISSIDTDAFNYTTSLVTLDLSQNKISEIREGTFDKLHSLRSLSLEGNNLVKLNAVNTFRSLIHLENLSLGNNNIFNIAGGTFENLGSLKTLVLSSNELTSIDSGTFSNLTSLEKLSLANNHLSQILDGCMPTSGSLITLDLQKNKFTSMEHVSLENLGNLLFLSLKNNPLIAINLYRHSIVPQNLTIIVENRCPNTGTSSNFAWWDLN